jgi:hypothetical protein
MVMDHQLLYVVLGKLLLPTLQGMSLLQEEMEEPQLAHMDDTVDQTRMMEVVTVGLVDKPEKGKMSVDTTSFYT